jgi:hypothetical protein
VDVSAAVMHRLRAVSRAADAELAAVQDMGVDHRRGDALVPEELLDGAKVVRSVRYSPRTVQRQGCATLTCGGKISAITTP